MRSGVQQELYIRLYADGHGEYEVTTPTPAGVVETGMARLKKEYSAENLEISEILRVGRSPGFQKERDSYATFVHKTDSSLLTIVEFKDKGRTKQIALSNFYDRSPANKEHYPSSVIKMIEKAGEIRRRAMGTVGRN